MSKRGRKKQSKSRTHANRQKQNSAPPRAPSATAPTQSAVVLPAPVSKFEGTERINYLENLVSKQLDLYTWCEEKIATLATIDTILLAGATLFVGRIKSNIFPLRVPDNYLKQIMNFIENNFTIVMVFVMFVPIFFSLGLTLLHVIPKMGNVSTKSPQPNHRSSNGIRQFKSREEYKKYFYSLPASRICDDLLIQIYGMNTNIWKNQKLIKLAVTFDLVGLVGFLVIMLYLVFTGNSSVIFS